ncbi:MAG: hypothetical protein AVDCRST_MAG09-424, partial [uncultured Sphingomonas sp.]
CLGRSPALTSVTNWPAATKASVGRFWVMEQPPLPVADLALWALLWRSVGVARSCTTGINRVASLRATRARPRRAVRTRGRTAC